MTTLISIINAPFSMYHFDSEQTRVAFSVLLSICPHLAVTQACSCRPGCKNIFPHTSLVRSGRNFAKRLHSYWQSGMEKYMLLTSLWDNVKCHERTRTHHSTLVSLVGTVNLYLPPSSTIKPYYMVESKSLETAADFICFWLIQTSQNIIKD
jgi:hypothetical protein